MNSKSLVSFLFMLAAALSAAAQAQTLDKIRKQGAITLGYIDGAAPFSTPIRTATRRATRSSSAARSPRASRPSSSARSSRRAG